MSNESIHSVLSDIETFNYTSPAASLREKRYTPTSLLSKKPSIKITLSKWSTGWKTLSSMYLFYLLALTLAIVHLFLFRYLDGKSADDNDLCSGFRNCIAVTAISQTYTSTAAILLSNAFTIAIRMALSITFTQHLWKILRKSALKVHTIEMLFNIRSDFFKLFHFSVIKTSWILVTIAILIYLVPVASSFPPGALTIKSINPLISGSAIVPTFNASYTGNETAIVSALTGFSSSHYLPPKDIVNYESQNSSDYMEVLFAMTQWPLVSLERLAATISLSGEPLPMPSPCGPNCSYILQFEGPSLKCSEMTADQIISSGIDTIFSALWSSFDIENEYNQNNILDPEPALSQLRLNTSVLSPPYFTGPYFTPNSTVSANVSNLSCVPFRSLYAVKNSYTNNIQTLNYTTEHLAQLANTNKPSDWINLNTTLNWTTDNFAWYRDCQLMGIITAMASVINGSCSSFGIYHQIPGYWSSELLSCAGSRGPFVPYTQLSDDFHDYTLQSYTLDSPASFTVTEERLNSLLANLTLSIIVALNAWHQTVNITQFPSHNVYTFSRPLNLIIPYFLTLFVSLPFLIIGTLALRENGVPATDGSFIQILSTTTGSHSLERAAAGNCLGGDGDDNCVERLMDLKVQYGELVDMQVQVGSTIVRRAGFGTKDEVIPLKKGEKYGIVA